MLPEPVVYTGAKGCKCTKCQNVNNWGRDHHPLPLHHWFVSMFGNCANLKGTLFSSPFFKGQISREHHQEWQWFLISPENCSLLLPFKERGGWPQEWLGSQLSQKQYVLLSTTGSHPGAVLCFLPSSSISLGAFHTWQRKLYQRRGCLLFSKQSSGGSGSEVTAVMMS